MNKVFGTLLFCAGIAIIFAGLYVGVWLMLIGGIVDIINQIKAPETDALTIALAIVKVLFFELPIVAGIWLGVVVSSFGSFYVFSRREGWSNRNNRWLRM